MSGMAAHAGRASSEFRCREEVRQRIALLHGTWRGRPDAAHNKAIAAIGATVRRQALIMGFSDTFAVTLLAVAAIVLLFARKMGRSGAAD
jgi:MFS transporter, DHA2 family, multidrug resistance protein